MNTFLVVVVIGVVIAMVVMMIRYAGFIHRFPQQEESEERGKPSDEQKPPTDSSTS